jgi:hypothetical protein
VASIFEVTKEVGECAYLWVKKLLSSTHICCGGWGEIQHYVTGGGAVLPT